MRSVIYAIQGDNNMPNTDCFKKCSNICCINVVLTILGIVLGLTVGVILGITLFENVGLVTDIIILTSLALKVGVCA